MVREKWLSEEKESDVGYHEVDYYWVRWSYLRTK